LQANHFSTNYFKDMAILTRQQKPLGIFFLKIRKSIRLILKAKKTKSLKPWLFMDQLF